MTQNFGENLKHFCDKSTDRLSLLQFLRGGGGGGGGEGFDMNSNKQQGQVDIRSFRQVPQTME